MMVIYLECVMLPSEIDCFGDLEMIMMSLVLGKNNIKQKFKMRGFSRLVSRRKEIIVHQDAT